MKPRLISTEHLRQAWQNRQTSRDSVRLGEVILGLLRAEGLDKPNPVQELRDKWEALVGNELARHSRLEAFRRGVLRVAVDSGAHLAELQAMVRSGLAEQITALPGSTAIKSIRLHLG